MKAYLLKKIFSSKNAICCLVTVLLCVVLGLSFAGCKDSENNADKNNPSSGSQSSTYEYKLAMVLEVLQRM
jgi:uncharacterized lipoprotein YehR (DUF1307 family)